MQDLDLSMLKILISDKKCAIDYVGNFDTRLFSPEYWNFAELVYNYIKLYKNSPTLNTLEDKCGENEKLKTYVTSLWNKISTIDVKDNEYGFILDKLKTRYAIKELEVAQEKLSKLQTSKVDVSSMTKSIQKVLNNINSLSSKKIYEKHSLKEAIPLFKEEYNAKLKDPNFDSGIKTGYKFMDYATDGFRPGELVLIGGESSAGKSMLLMNLAIQMWLQKNKVEKQETYSQGYNVLYFSLEMPFKPCLNRILGRLSGTPTKKIRNAKLNAVEKTKLKNTLSFINSYPYTFDIVEVPRGITVETIGSLFDEAMINYIPDIVVVDYLGLMDCVNGASLDDWLKLGIVSEQLHEFAKSRKVVLLSAIQLNRMKPTKDNSDERIGMHRIGRSGLIMNNANIGFQIESRLNERSYHDMIVHFIKNRDGELLKGRLLKDWSCGTIIDDDNVEESDLEFLDIDDISGEMEELGL